jgi:hypothetical protein
MRKARMIAVTRAITGWEFAKEPIWAVNARMMSRKFIRTISTPYRIEGDLIFFLTFSHPLIFFPAVLSKHAMCEEHASRAEGSGALKRFFVSTVTLSS